MNTSPNSMQAVKWYDISSPLLVVVPFEKESLRRPDTPDSISSPSGAGSPIKRRLGTPVGTAGSERIRASSAALTRFSVVSEESDLDSEDFEFIAKESDSMVIYSEPTETACDIATVGIKGVKNTLCRLEKIEKLYDKEKLNIKIPDFNEAETSTMPKHPKLLKIFNDLKQAKKSGDISHLYKVVEVKPGNVLCSYKLPKEFSMSQFIRAQKIIMEQIEYPKHVNQFGRFAGWLRTVIDPLNQQIIRSLG